MTTTTAIADQVLLNLAVRIREFASRAMDSYDVTVYAAGLAAMSGLVCVWPGQTNGPLLGVARKLDITTSDEDDSRQISVRITDVETRTVDVTVDI